MNVRWLPVFLLACMACHRKPIPETTTPATNTASLPDTTPLMLSTPQTDTARRLTAPEAALAMLQEHPEGIRYDAGWVSPHDHLPLAWVNVGDTISFLFTCKDKDWQLVSDSLRYPDEEQIILDGARPLVADINGDGRKDVLMPQWPDIHGDARFMVFTALPDGTFKARPDVHLHNIYYDPVRKVVTSFYIGNIYNPLGKEVYKWVHDTLQFQEGVEEWQEKDGRKPELQFIRGNRHNPPYKTLPANAVDWDHYLFDIKKNDYYAGQ